MITDNGSFLGEYLPTGRPIVFTSNYSDRTTNVNSYGQLLTSEHYYAFDVQQLNQCLHKIVIENDDYLKPKRIEVIHQYMYLPPQGAASNIIQELLKEVKL